jgi:hypothetical protein
MRLLLHSPCPISFMGRFNQYGKLVHWEDAWFKKAKINPERSLPLLFLIPWHFLVRFLIYMSIFRHVRLGVDQIVIWYHFWRTMTFVRWGSIHRDHIFDYFVFSSSFPQNHLDGSLACFVQWFERESWSLVFSAPTDFNGRCSMHGMGFGRWRWSFLFSEIEVDWWWLWILRLHHAAPKFEDSEIRRFGDLMLSGGRSGGVAE